MPVHWGLVSNIGVCSEGREFKRELMWPVGNSWGRESGSGWKQGAGTGIHHILWPLKTGAHGCLLSVVWRMLCSGLVYRRRNFDLTMQIRFPKSHLLAFLLPLKSPQSLVGKIQNVIGLQRREDGKCQINRDQRQQNFIVLPQGCGKSHTVKLWDCG